MRQIRWGNRESQCNDSKQRHFIRYQSGRKRSKQKISKKQEQKEEASERLKSKQKQSNLKQFLYNSINKFNCYPSHQGLQNIGNTCFLNSAIQFLYSSINLRQQIKQIKAPINSFQRNIVNIFKSLQNKESRYQQKYGLMQELTQRLKNMRINYLQWSQQDSLQFLLIILTKLFNKSQIIEKLFTLYYKLICSSSQDKLRNKQNNLLYKGQSKCDYSMKFNEFSLTSLRMLCEKCSNQMQIKFINKPKCIILQDCQYIKPYIQFQTVKKQILSYQLMAKLIYSGDGQFGHYKVSRRMKQDSEQFYVFNDSSVYKQNYPYYYNNQQKNNKPSFRQINKNNCSSSLNKNNNNRPRDINYERRSPYLIGQSDYYSTRYDYYDQSGRKSNSCILALYQLVQNDNNNNKRKSISVFKNNNKKYKQKINQQSFVNDSQKQNQNNLNQNSTLHLTIKLNGSQINTRKQYDQLVKNQQRSKLSVFNKKESTIFSHKYTQPKQINQKQKQTNQIQLIDQILSQQQYKYTNSSIKKLNQVQTFSKYPIIQSKRQQILQATNNVLNKDLKQLQKVNFFSVSTTFYKQIDQIRQSDEQNLQKIVYFLYSSQIFKSLIIPDVRISIQNVQKLIRQMFIFYQFNNKNNNKQENQYFRKLVKGLRSVLNSIYVTYSSNALDIQNNNNTLCDNNNNNHKYPQTVYMPIFMLKLILNQLRKQNSQLDIFQFQFLYSCSNCRQPHQQKGIIFSFNLCCSYCRKIIQFQKVRLISICKCLIVYQVQYCTKQFIQFKYQPSRDIIRYKFQKKYFLQNGAYLNLYDLMQTQSNHQSIRNNFNGNITFNNKEFSNNCEINLKTRNSYIIYSNNKQRNHKQEQKTQKHIIDDIKLKQSNQNKTFYLFNLKLPQINDQQLNLVVQESQTLSSLLQRKIRNRSYFNNYYNYKKQVELHINGHFRFYSSWKNDTFKYLKNVFNLKSMAQSSDPNVMYINKN